MTESAQGKARTFALAIAHPGASALADCLCAVDWEGAVAGSDDFGFSDFLALADDVVAGSNNLRCS